MSFIGTQPGYAYNTITKDTFNGTGSQTAFTLSVPATTNGVEVFVENVQQEPTTAYSVSGTTLTFTAAPVSGTGNIYVVHRNPTVQTLVPPSDIALNVASITTTGSATFGDGLTVDNDGATVATFDRATDNGTIAEFQKDGTAVGSIGTYDTDIHIGSGDVGLSFYDVGDTVLPFNPSTPVYRDNAIDLGNSSNRFKDLYLSGGVYVGGTGAANYLDDYEEGTFTPALIADTNPTGVVYNEQIGRYTKVGNKVHIEISLRISNKGSGGSGAAYFGGLPFTSVSVANHYPNFGIALGPLNSAKAGYMTGQISTGESRITLVYNNNTTSGLAALLLSDITNTTNFRAIFSYEV